MLRTALDFDHPIDLERLGDALQRLSAEAFDKKVALHQPERLLADHHPIARGQLLQPGADVERIADQPVLLRRRPGRRFHR